MKLPVKQFDSFVNKRNFWLYLLVTWLIISAIVYLYWTIFFSFCGYELVSVDYARQGFANFIVNY